LQNYCPATAIWVRVSRFIPLEAGIKRHLSEALKEVPLRRRPVVKMSLSTEPKVLTWTRLYPQLSSVENGENT